VLLVDDNPALFRGCEDSGGSAAPVRGHHGKTILHAPGWLDGDQNPGPFRTHDSLSIQQGGLSAGGGSLGSGFRVPRLAVNLFQQRDGKQNASVPQNDQHQVRRPCDFFVQRPGQRRGRRNGNCDMRWLLIADATLLIGIDAGLAVFCGTAMEAAGWGGAGRFAPA